ncbi:MAG: sugar phosphate isomerase/epimerase [Candidatus Bathyarchaeota archaeon]|nr:sugar phosphate isomerase/epimerase [Candidatus Bathyarchaeota archaeon]
MKLGLNSVTFRNETPVRRIEIAKDLGFDGIEVLGFPQEMTSESMQETKKALNEIGIEAPLVALGPPLALSGGELAIESQDPDISSKTLEHIKRCIDYTSDLNGELIYVCTTRPKSEFKDQNKALEDTKRFLVELAEYASGNGIKVSIEHSPGSLIDTASFLNSILKELDLDNLGALLDIGHLNMTEEDRAATVMNTEKLFHVHLDNNDGKNDIHTPLNVGTLTEKDFSDFFGALKRRDYDGYISIELLNLQEPMKTLKESVDFVKKIYDSS